MDAKRVIWSSAFLVVLSLFSVDAHADGRKIVVEGFRAHERTLSLGISGTGLTLGDDNLDEHGSASLGGATLNFRWNPSSWFGLEVAAGGYSRMSRGGSIKEERALGGLSALWYFASHHRHRFYGVTGLVSIETNLNIRDEETVVYSENGVALGLGSEWMFSGGWVLHADARLLSLSLDEEALEGTDQELQSTRSEYLPAKERGGVMFNVGVGYRW